MARKILVVSHSRTGGTASLVEMVLEGARDDAISGVDVETRSALDATADDVRGVDGIVLATPANFGYMSGALKHFFDEVFYELGDDTAGLPYVLLVKGRTDASGAVSAVERIATGLGWKQARPPLVVVGDATDGDRDAAWELGASFAASISEGLI